MLSKAQQDYLAKSVMPMQIIVGALAAGVLTFFVIVLIVSREGVPSEPFLTYIALVFTALAFAGWILVPHLVASQARQSIATGRTPYSAAQTVVPSEVGAVGQLAAVFQTRLIIANALLEGAALFSLIAYMLEGQYLCLGIAAVLVLVILSQIPTRNRLEDWVSHELETIEQMRT